MSEGHDVNDTYPQADPAKKKWRFHIPAGFVVFLLVAGFVVLMSYVGKNKVKGTVTLATPAKTWTMNVDSCTSGERKQFFGVMFFDDKQPETGGRLALPEDAEAHISLNRPDADYGIKYTKSDCSVWDVDLHRTNTQYNGIWGVEGHARFDCTTTDETASHAVGNLTFDSCH